jgi:hypothetical protein
VLKILKFFDANPGSFWSWIRDGKNRIRDLGSATLQIKVSQGITNKSIDDKQNQSEPDQQSLAHQTTASQSNASKKNRKSINSQSKFNPQYINSHFNNPSNKQQRLNNNRSTANRPIRQSIGNHSINCV